MKNKFVIEQIEISNGKQEKWYLGVCKCHYNRAVRQSSLHKTPFATPLKTCTPGRLKQLGSRFVPILSIIFLTETLVINIFMRLLLIISHIVSLDVGIILGNCRSGIAAIDRDACGIIKDTLQVFMFRIHPL